MRALAAGLALAGSFLAAPLAAQDTHLVLVVGLSGEGSYKDRFHGWASTIREAAVGRLGVAEANVVWLADDTAAAPGKIRDRATLAALRAVVAGIDQRAGAEDRIVFVLIGHGTERDAKPLFNLTGPDLTAADFAVMLGALAPRRVAVVNTASASGAFVAGLSGPGRTIIAATRSGRENNETWFAGFFADALAQEASDLDKDGRVSLFEAFEYARAETARYFEEKKLLVTEHAVIDDDGDGQATMEPKPGEGDGVLANSFFVGGGARTAAAQAAAAADPVLRGLLDEAARLEERIATLRGQKDVMPVEEYEGQLETLLVDLALKNREIRERGGER